jgi:hypothetical protein
MSMDKELELALELLFSGNTIANSIDDYYNFIKKRDQFLYEYIRQKHPEWKHIRPIYQLGKFNPVDIVGW